MLALKKCQWENGLHVIIRQGVNLTLSVLQNASAFPTHGPAERLSVHTIGSFSFYICDWCRRLHDLKPSHHAIEVLTFQ